MKKYGGGGLEKLANALLLRVIREAQGVLAGAYGSCFSGEGLDFSGLEEYEPGGDSRFIHWPRSALSGRLLCRRFETLRNMPMVLGVDVSGSMIGFKTCRETWTEALLLLGSCAALLGQQFQMFCAAENFRLETKSAAGLRHLESLAVQLRSLNFRRRTDFGGLSAHIGKRLNQRSCLFLFSDLFDTEYSMELGVLAREHQVTVFHVFHEIPFVPAGADTVEDAETGAVFPVSGDFSSELEDFTARSRELVVSAGAEYVPLSAGKPVLSVLLRHFRRRQEIR